MSSLEYRERRAAGRGDPEGLLMLHHGRGSDEQDLLGLADVLDPCQRLHVVAPRAPLTLPGSPGYHWYVVPRVGYPDPDTFRAANRELASFHDALWERTGIAPEQTVLGGFSMGSVMSYALGLSGDRPAPAGILAFSGFVPTVEGWQPDLARRPGLRAFAPTGAATRSWPSTSRVRPGSCSNPAGWRSSTTSPTPPTTSTPRTRPPRSPG
jgi:phospholipase/carboxylesterase